MVSLKKNFIYSIAYQALVIILPLITAPYVSRVLGAEGIGEYSYTQSVAYYFILMAMLGISQQGNRAIAEVGEDIEKRSSKFWSIYSIQMFTHIIAITIYVFYLILGTDKSIIPWIQLIYLCSSLFDISWLFFGMEQFKITVLRNTIIKISTAILIFILVKSRDDLWLYTLILVSGTLLSQIYLWFYLKKYIIFTKPDWSSIKQQIKPILILFIPVLAYSIYKVMDKIMLGSMASYEQVGFYENAFKINNIPISLITAIGTVMLPRMTAMASKGQKDESCKFIKKTFSIINVLASALVFGIAGISNNFVNVYYGAEFNACSSLMVWLNWTVFFVAWANIMRTQYLIPNKRDNVYVVSTVLGAVVNLLINFILIGSLQALGASIGTFFAEFTVMIVQLIAIRKELPVMRYISDSIPYFINGAVMMFLVRGIGKIMGMGIMELMVQIIIGGAFYIVVASAIAFRKKDDIYSMIMIPLLKKFKIIKTNSNEECI